MNLYSTGLKGRLAVSVMVRDVDLNSPDARGVHRLEILADGLELVDTSLVSLVRGDGSPLGAAAAHGVALIMDKKEITHPELVGLHSRAHLVVLAGEVGGRWSEETRSFACWCGPKLFQNRSSHRKELSRRGGCDGCNTGVQCCSCVRIVPHRPQSGSLDA